MSDEIKALVERARNRINDAPLETERLIDDLADCVEALSIPSDDQFVFLDEHPGEGVPFRKVTKDEALKLFHERLTAQADEIERLRGLIAGPAAWLERWGNHVGNCAGGDVCTCGLTLARYESSAALKAAQEVKA